jgi:5'-3' exonuclease
MIALLDCDIMIHRVGYTTQDDDISIAVWRLEDLIGRTCSAIEASGNQVYLTSTDKSNFRYRLANDYKANRTQEKPIHYEALRQHLIQHLEAIVVDGQEADDALGIEQASRMDSCIVTIDKDLDMIPGMHYNFVKEVLYDISPLEGIRSFFWQVLVGDRTDNVQGCPGIGVAKATRILEGCQDETEMLTAVVKQYRKALPDSWLNSLYLAGNLLWIRQKPNQPWEKDSKAVSKDVLQSVADSLE